MLFTATPIYRCNKHFHGDLCQEPNANPVWDTVITTDTRNTTDLFQARASHASTLIGDDVYIFGGLTFTTFNPQRPGHQHASSLSTNAITMLSLEERAFYVVNTTNTPPSPRYDHSMIEFDRKLFVYGGVINNNLITNEFWSFDMRTRRWTLLNAHNESDSSTPVAVAGNLQSPLSRDS